MKILEIIQQPEGRRLEFKETLPSAADLAKTIVAFANDAGGELYIGIKDKPRKLVGVPEEELMNLEEQISNLIHDHCYPLILPSISFHTVEGIHLIKVQIFRGSNLPYYLKSKGKLEGTYIRVGSANRQASQEIIAELERQKRNISFDSELVHDKRPQDLNITKFKEFYQQKTGEELNDIALRKLELLKEFQGVWLPTNGLILFSEEDVRKEMFPYAKVECARFKGATTDEFIDQKTIDNNISVQAEAAYEFIIRHINKGATVRGVYTESRWEYPVVAIREAIRNAVVHRDYSLTGKDIKVAVYDDMVEITSPGKLMPSIDFNELEARQSDIRNKVIARVFKKIGLIDQWGNGLKLIADELKKYPEIEFKWFEKGLQFQLQFIKRDFKGPKEVPEAVQHELDVIWHQVGTKLALSRHQVEQILQYGLEPRGLQEIMEVVQWKDKTKFRNKYMKPLLALGLLAMTNPAKPTSSKQQYYTTGKGKALVTKS